MQHGIVRTAEKAIWCVLDVRTRSAPAVAAEGGAPLRPPIVGARLVASSIIETVPKMNLMRFADALLQLVGRRINDLQVHGFGNGEGS